MTTNKKVDPNLFATLKAFSDALPETFDLNTMTAEANIDGLDIDLKITLKGMAEIEKHINARQKEEERLAGIPPSKRKSFDSIAQETLVNFPSIDPALAQLVIWTASKKGMAKNDKIYSLAQIEALFDKAHDKQDEDPTYINMISVSLFLIIMQVDFIRKGVKMYRAGTLEAETEEAEENGPLATKSI